MHTNNNGTDLRQNQPPKCQGKHSRAYWSTSIITDLGYKLQVIFLVASREQKGSSALKISDENFLKPSA